MTITTQDGFLGGQLHLIQPAKGHRAGTDAALLAACVGTDAKGLAYDLGSGVGTAGMAAAVRAPNLRVGLVEIEPATAELARLNVANNHLADRVFLIETDIAELGKPSDPSKTASNSADIVIINPPFHTHGTVRSSSNAEKCLAHQNDEKGLDCWVKAAARLLKPRAVLFLIHRADKLTAILRGLEGRFGDIRLKPIHAYAAEPATRLLVRAVKGSRQTSSLLPPLVLHDHDGSFTQEAKNLHTGEGSIDWLL